MNQQNIIIGILAVIAVLTGVSVFKTVPSAQTQTKFGDVSNYNTMSVPTASGVLCGNTSTLLLATSSAGRPFVSISNLSATNVYVGYDSASLYTGIMIPASSTITMNQNSINYHALYCIAASNASTSLDYVN